MEFTGADLQLYLASTLFSIFFFFLYLVFHNNKLKKLVDKVILGDKLN